MKQAVVDPLLPLVRRFEAAGFRAWPASSVQYDGAWVLRLNSGHPAKRLNSVNPLDPGDIRNMDERIERAGRRFSAFGRPLTFRISPLAAPELSNYFDNRNWAQFGESLVMRADVSTLPLADVIPQIPLKDIGRFMDAVMDVHAIDPMVRPGLTEVIDSINPEIGLFVLEEDVERLATAICVHDGDIAGLFEVATGPRVRGKGHGRRVVLTALKWAAMRGARQAWLQVEASNEPALKLYRALGFQEIYRYHYRRAGENDE